MPTRVSTLPSTAPPRPPRREWSSGSHWLPGLRHSTRSSPILARGLAAPLLVASLSPGMAQHGDAAPERATMACTGEAPHPSSYGPGCAEGLFPVATERTASPPGKPVLTGAQLELESVVQRALEANPSLAAAEQRRVAAAAVPEGLRSLPDPRLRTGFYGVPLDALNPFDGQLRVQYAQEIPYPGTLERRSLLAGHEADRAAELSRARRVRVAAAARRAWWELYFAHRAREIHHQHLALVRELSTSAEELYATGQVPQENALRALVELTELFAELSAVDARISLAAARLNAVLHRPPDATLGVPRRSGESTPVPEMESLLELATSRNPHLAAAADAVGREGARVELERHEARPDFAFTGEWWTASDGMGGRFERWAALVTVSLPWIHDDKYTAAVDEAMASRRAAEADRLALLDEVRRDVFGARERLATAVRIADLYRTSVLPQSEQSLRAARAAYESGTVDFVTIADNERTLLLNRLALVRAEADAGVARADLLEAVGVVEPAAIVATSDPAEGDETGPDGRSAARTGAGSSREYRR